MKKDIKWTLLMSKDELLASAKERQVDSPDDFELILLSIIHSSEDFASFREGIYAGGKEYLMAFSRNKAYIFKYVSDIDIERVKTVYSIIETAFQDWVNRYVRDVSYKEKFTFLGLMTRGLAHEINNPLAIISSYTQFLQLNETDKEKEKILNNILETVMRASNIIKKISHFAKGSGEKEKCGLEKECITVIDFFENVRKYKFPHVGIELAKGISEEHIVVNRTDFQEALFVLLENACESIEKEKGKIILSVEGGKETVVLTIKDNGKGIKQNDIVKLFNPFFSTKQKDHGAGLGLTIVQFLLAKNDASIRIDSEEGIGTNCIITFRKEDENTSG